MADQKKDTALAASSESGAGERHPLILDPDYARIFTKARIIAWQHGYALTLHGSLTRDLDLVLIPWTEEAKSHDPEGVVRYLAQVTETEITHAPSDKPHGRRAWTLHLPGFGEPRWVDLSVVPASISTRDAASERASSVDCRDCEWVGEAPDEDVCPSCGSVGLRRYPDYIRTIRWLQSNLRDAGYCPDGGKCHHSCEHCADCFRQNTCLPLSGSGLSDDWTLREAASERAVRDDELPGMWATSDFTGGREYSNGAAIVSAAIRTSDAPNAQAGTVEGLREQIASVAKDYLNEPALSALLRSLDELAALASREAQAGTPSDERAALDGKAPTNSDRRTALTLLPKVGPICYASIVDVEAYRPHLNCGPHLPGVRDVALWSTDQVAYAVRAALASRGAEGVTEDLRRLHAVATGKLRHDFQGDCPDELNGPDMRDKECPACRVLMIFDAAIAAGKGEA